MSPYRSLKQRGFLLNPFTFGSGIPPEPVADPYFENVVLLLDGTGTDGSTAIVDRSLQAHPITVNGATEIDSDVLIFDKSTIKFPGGFNDFLSIADDIDFDFGSGDFTIEFILRPTATYFWWIMGKGDSTTAPGSSFSIYNGTVWDFYHSGGSSASVPKINYTVNHTYYWAVVRSGSEINNYGGEVGVDVGTTKISTTAGAINSNPLNVTTSPVFVGRYGTTAFMGNVAGVRITKGIARNVSLVPTDRFPAF